MPPVQNTTELALKVRLSPHARERLIEGAARVGRPLDDYASELLEHAAEVADLDAILAPLRKEFAESGTSDEQLIEQINEGREEYHAAASATARYSSLRKIPATHTPSPRASWPAKAAKPERRN